MKELVANRSVSKANVRPYCAITFDDGWLDNYTNALPLLRRYRLPATIFISTDFIGSERVPWFYALLRCFPVVSDLLDNHGMTVDMLRNMQLPEPLIRWAQNPSSERLKDIEPTMERLKHFPGEQLDAAADELAGKIQQLSTNGSCVERSMLNWSEVKEMSAAGMEIGSHGMAHWVLTRISPCQVEKEIVESKAIIEKQLGNTIDGFSYPNGDYSESVAACLQKAGYAYACTIAPGYIDQKSDAYSLNRLLLHDENTHATALFACHVAGLFNRGRR